MSRYTALIVLVAAGVPGFAQVVSYEAESFPEDSRDSWVRLDTVFPADRWLSDGWFVQAPVVLKCPPFICLSQDHYRRELADQAGDQTDETGWFMEWHMITNGPQAFGAVAPASIVASGFTGILYHFTIAKDRVRLIRGAQFPIVFTAGVAFAQPSDPECNSNGGPWESCRSVHIFPAPHVTVALWIARLRERDTSRPKQDGKTNDQLVILFVHLFFLNQREIPCYLLQNKA